MPWITIYLVGAFISAAVTLLLTVYAWRHRDAPGASGFAVMMACVTFWSFCAVLEAVNMASPLARDFWRSLKYIGLASVPVGLLLFALQSLGSSWLTARRALLLFVVPVITQGIIWTNGWHLLWTGLDGQRGTWFWIHTTYSFVVIFVGMIMVVTSLPSATPLRRRQLTTILIGFLIPLAINIAHTFGFIPYVVDLTPLAFTFSGPLFAWTMYRQRLFSLTPVAREVVVDDMADGMLVLDKDNRIVDSNPAMQIILHQPAPNLHGRPIAEVLPGWPELFAELSSTSFYHNELTVGQGMDERHYEAHLSPLYDREQGLAGYVLLLHDITVRKRAERVIQEYAHELEARNAELEARNAELDAFAHTVAHDLKNPLGTIVGFSSLLERYDTNMPPEKRLENIQRIAQVGNKAIAIIDELLLLASVRKMEKVKCAPINMRAVVAEALDRCSEQIRETQSEVRMAEDWPFAVGYAPWVEEVWVNYISNALKYGGHPETRIPPRVELGFSLLNADSPSLLESPVQASNASSEVLFWVRDNGPGVDKKAQSKLFAEFSQLDEMRARGHGLGLSIVRRIVEKLGGAVGVESGEGQGSTFWFTLPLADLPVETSS